LVRSSAPSAASGSFEVAWRSMDRASASASMPSPSSSTRIRPAPPAAMVTAMRRAPASSAFSTSSFTTAAGRSTTSPAAIRLMVPSGRRRILARAFTSSPIAASLKAGTKSRRRAMPAPPALRFASVTGWGLFSKQMTRTNTRCRGGAGCACGLGCAIAGKFPAMLTKGAWVEIFWPSR
jgi:hypothetical protein